MQEQLRQFEQVVGQKENVLKESQQVTEKTEFLRNKCEGVLEDIATMKMGIAGARDMLARMNPDMFGPGGVAAVDLEKEAFEEQTRQSQEMLEAYESRKSSYFSHASPTFSSFPTPNAAVEAKVVADTAQRSTTSPSRTFPSSHQQPGVPKTATGTSWKEGRVPLSQHAPLQRQLAETRILQHVYDRQQMERLQQEEGSRQTPQEPKAQSVGWTSRNSGSSPKKGSSTARAADIREQIYVLMQQLQPSLEQLQQQQPLLPH